MVKLLVVTVLHIQDKHSLEPSVTETRLFDIALQYHNSSGTHPDYSLFEIGLCFSSPYPHSYVDIISIDTLVVLAVLYG
jgi:hypothetical protein